MSAKSPNSLFDPPSSFTLFTWAPLKYLTIRIYRCLVLPKVSLPKPLRAPIRVVCISDTHNRICQIPAGDILIHSGDLTESGTPRELQAQIDWLDAQPHKYKIAIAGNHDAFLDPTSRRTLSDVAQAGNVDWKGIRYLCGESNTLQFPEHDGREIHVYGAPHVPQCGGSSFAFQYPRYRHPWKDTIPQDTDILVTHTPPRYYHDISQGSYVSVGCAGLLEETWSVRPKLHVFGHIHAARGRSVVNWNGAKRAYEGAAGRKGDGVRDMMRPQSWMDLLVVVFSVFLVGLMNLMGLKINERSKTILVNAAVCYDDVTGSPEPVQAIDI